MKISIIKTAINTENVTEKENTAKTQLVCIDDYEKYALGHLTKSVKDYYRAGSGDEYTLNLNKRALRKIRIRQRVLRDASKRDISTTVLGEKVSMPLGVSPTAMQKMAHPDGECANARAVQAAKTIFILSTLSTSSIEEVAQAAPEAIKWFQLYIYDDRSISYNLVKRAERAGFKAIALTVDSPMYSDKRPDMRNDFALPSHLRYANFDDLLPQRSNDLALEEVDVFDESLTWKDVEWLVSITNLPIVLKGILTSEDAILGVKHGASAILVSNHGGRQLNGAPASIEALPEIVNAVGDKVEVYLDGGIAQGTDVLKAIALGAKMVFFGRPMLWGLTYAGEKGARDVLEIMRREIDEAFALSGCTNVQEVPKELVVHESFYYSNLY